MCYSGGQYVHKCYSCLCEALTCMCGTFIDVHTFYKMYLNEYILARQSLKRIALHNDTISSQYIYLLNIVSGYSEWASVVCNRVLHHMKSKKFYFFVFKRKLSWHSWGISYTSSLVILCVVCERACKNQPCDYKIIQSYIFDCIFSCECSILLL